MQFLKMYTCGGPRTWHWSGQSHCQTITAYTRCPGPLSATKRQFQLDHDILDQRQKKNRSSPHRTLRSRPPNNEIQADTGTMPSNSPIIPSGAPTFPESLAASELMIPLHIDDPQTMNDNQRLDQNSLR